MDLMQWRWNESEGKSDPKRVEWHVGEPKERGFYHDEDGEPKEYYLEPERELKF
jgi:hypothetical protein